MAESQNGHLHVSPADVRSTLEKHILVDGFHVVQDLEKSHGSYIYDVVTNRKILDFYTSFSTMPLGYNHPKLMDTKFQARLLPSALNKIANSDIYTHEFAEFVEKFSRTFPEELRAHLFFIDGGALAVENALKAAFDWKVRKNIANGKGEKGGKIIHFKEAFHGRSGYTMSLTNTDPTKVLYYPKFDWPRIINPKLTFSHGQVLPEVLEEVKKVEQQAIEQIEKAVADNPDDIAGLIIEPIQGEGGDNHFRAEFLAELRRLADKHEFLLIFDEVQTGFGTTGKYWALEHFGVIPDVLVFGKKTQTCGIAASHRLDQVSSVFHVSSRINSTWGGNIVDMVRCTRILEIIEEDKLIEHAAKVGKVLLDGLLTLEKKFPGKITNVRGRGMFVAFDTPDKETRNKAIRSMEQHNLMCLTSGVRSIRCRPPLTLSEEEATKAVKIMEDSFQELFGKV